VFLEKNITGIASKTSQRRKKKRKIFEKKTFSGVE